MAFTLSSENLTFAALEKIYQEKLLLEIAPDIIELLNSIPASTSDNNNRLVENYLTAHVVGFGPPVPESIIRLTLALHLHALIQGSVQTPHLAVIQRLLAFYNREVWPLVYQQSSPVSQLTQLCLPLVGKGKVSFQGYELNATDVMDIFSWPPLSLSTAEVDVLINQHSLTQAFVVHNLLQLQPYVNWLEYLIQMFHQIAAIQPNALLTEWQQLTNAVAASRQNMEENFALPFVKQKMALVREHTFTLLKALNQITSAITEITSETFENLNSSSEPPATTSFNLASDLVLSLKKQLRLTFISPTDTIVTNKDMRILHQELTAAITLTEQVITLAFWSVAQVGRLFNLAPGNLTLSTYYHSSFYVPKEMVSDQLDKTLHFIRTTSPAPTT